VANKAPAGKWARQRSPQRIEGLSAGAILQAVDGEQGRHVAAFAAIEGSFRFTYQTQAFGSSEVALRGAGEVSRWSNLYAPKWVGASTSGSAR
jgi:hypothetical protein